MDHELIKAAACAAIGALTKAAAEPALGAGRKVWDWLKGKLSGDDEKTAATVEADPARPSAEAKVTALLQDVLYASPQSAEELRKLLEAGGLHAVTQTANVTGRDNKVFQQSGSGNTARG